jgi:hypothetical protein
MTYYSTLPAPSAIPMKTSTPFVKNDHYTDPAKKKSAIGRYFRVVGNFLYQIPFYFTALAIAGVALLFLFPPLAPAVLGLTASLLATRLVVKLVDLYNSTALEKIKKGICRFNRPFSKIRIIAFVFSLAISALTPIAGCIVGCALGVYSGLLLEIEIYKKAQDVKSQKLKKPIYPSLNQLSLT